MKNVSVKLKTLKTFTLIGSVWLKSINLQQLHSKVGNFKQSYSKLGYIE